LGELVTWIAAGFLDAALLRVHADPISVLASARVELGAAGVEPSARAGAQALRQDAPFVAAHAVLRAELSLGEVSLALDGSFGFCAGLIVLADTREIAALDGVVVSWSLGIEGLP
ncbi:MAG: hypothetical protein K8H88_32585, partial [Sandaracinaceae bacterium]|nr:hypothetical protein [Sandaracinaceae bacterium]